MRAVIQRVLQAAVDVDGQRISEIGSGYLVLLCVEEGDAESDLCYMADKIPNLRIFEDDQGKMNRSIIDVSGELLLVSQFTLMGDARHGRRPSFSKAARPDVAVPMLDALILRLQSAGLTVKIGQFQADMRVSLVNDGPVTLLLDSRKGF